MALPSSCPEEVGLATLVVLSFSSHVFLVIYNFHLFLNLMEIQASNGSSIAIDDLGQLLECRPFSLDVEEVHESKFERNPTLLSMGSQRLATRQEIKYRRTRHAKADSGRLTVYIK